MNCRNWIEFLVGIRSFLRVLLFPCLLPQLMSVHAWFVPEMLCGVGMHVVRVVQTMLFRYHYLPAIVAAPVAALLFTRFPAALRLPASLRNLSALLLVAVLVVLTRAASRPWTNTVSLYTNARRFRATNTGFALNNFGYWFVLDI